MARVAVTPPGMLAAFWPASRPTDQATVLVQVTVKLPVWSRLVLALAPSGSYEPNARVPAEMRQFFGTVALTVTLAVLLAAWARDELPSTTAAAAAITAILRVMHFSFWGLNCGIRN